MNDKEYLINRFIRKSEETSDKVNLLSKTILSTNQKIDETNSSLDKTNNYISDIFDSIEVINNTKVNLSDTRLSDARKPLAHNHSIAEIKDLQTIISDLQKSIKDSLQYCDKKIQNISQKNFEPLIEEKAKELYKSIADINKRLAGVTNILSEQSSLINEYKNKPTQIIENNPVIQQIDLSAINDLYSKINEITKEIEKVTKGKIDFKKIEDKLFDKLSKSVKTTQQVTFVTRNGIQNLSQLKDVNIDTPTNGQTLIYNSITEQWENGSGGGGGTVNSVVAGENITVDNTDPANPIVASNGQSDGVTIIGNGTSATPFKYNEYVEKVMVTTRVLFDSDKYYTFTTDGTTNFDFDYTNITDPEFTFKVFVSPVNASQITIPVIGSIWLGNYQYFTSLYSSNKGAAMTLRFRDGVITVTNVCGNWDGN